jgi:hypothetical protein
MIPRILPPTRPRVRLTDRDPGTGGPEAAPADALGQGGQRQQRRGGGGSGSCGRTRGRTAWLPATAMKRAAGWGRGGGRDRPGSPSPSPCRSLREPVGVAEGESDIGLGYRAEHRKVMQIRREAGGVSGRSRGNWWFGDGGRGPLS